MNTSTPTVNEYTMLDSFVYDEYATTEIEKDFSCKLKCGPCREKTNEELMRDQRQRRLQAAQNNISRSYTSTDASAELRTMPIESEQ